MSSSACPHCLSSVLVPAAGASPTQVCPYCKAQVGPLDPRRRRARTGLNVLAGFLAGLLLGLVTFALLLATILLACRCAEEWKGKGQERIQEIHGDEGG